MKSYSLVLLVELDHILFYAGAECTAFYLSSIKSVLAFPVLFGGKKNISLLAQ